MTRRAWARLLAGGFLTFKARQACAAEVRGERRYRADAQVLVLSIPILRRSGVGGGSVVWREWQDSAGPARQLEFTGYSIPDHAAGLNRLGYIREKCLLAESGMREAAYFGVMTASPEENSEAAKKALHSTATEAAYTAIRGHMTPGQSETATATFTGPARLSAERRTELFTHAEQILANAPDRAPEFKPNGTVPAPFLHALADALRNPARRQMQYVYSGRMYRMTMQSAPDTKAAAYFRERRIIGANAQVLRMSGKVKRESGGKETEFRVWIEQGAPLPIPLRIDFLARAYLRLVMEAEI